MQCTIIHFSRYIYFFFLLSEKESRPFKPDIGQTTPRLLSLQLADLLKPLCATTIFPVTQHPNLPDCGGLWTRSGCGAARWFRIADELYGVQGSRICKQASYSPPTALQRWQRAPSQSCTEHPGGNTSCPLPSYQSREDSPLPLFPLGEITQGILNSGSIA